MGNSKTKIAYRGIDLSLDRDNVARYNELVYGGRSARRIDDYLMNEAKAHYLRS